MPGSITLKGDELMLDGGVASTTVGRGHGGSITLLAPDIQTEGAVSTSSSGSGNAGSIRIEARQVGLSGSGLIITEASQSGAAGDITIEADERVTMSGARISASTRREGEAGSVTIDAPVIELLGGELSVDALAGSTGLGGSIALRAGADLLVSGPATRVTARTEGSGTGGSIQVDTASLRVENGGEISTSSTAGGDAGSIVVGPRGRRYATENVLLSNGTISTTAEDAGGGDIRMIVSRSVRLEDGSEITASVGGGTGGNVFIAFPDELVLTGGSAILAQAEEGVGGRVEILADSVSVSPDSTIDASAQGGPDVQGDVTITSPETEIQSRVQPLETVLLDAASQMRPSCAARARQDLGSFAVLQGRDLFGSPDGLLLAFDDLDSPQSVDDGELPAVATAPGDTSVEQIEVAQVALAEGEAAFRGGTPRPPRVRWRPPPAPISGRAILTVARMRCAASVSPSRRGGSTLRRCQASKRLSTLLGPREIGDARPQLSAAWETAIWPWVRLPSPKSTSRVALSWHESPESPHWRGSCSPSWGTSAHRRPSTRRR